MMAPEFVVVGAGSLENALEICEKAVDLGLGVGCVANHDVRRC